MTRVVCISGGTTGIGHALVEAFVAEGDIVYTFSRHKDKVAGLKQKQEDNLHILQGDVTDTAFVTTLVKKIKTEQGRLNILINNAGIFEGEGGDIDETISAWKTMLDVNLVGAFGLTQACYPLLKGAENPSIINISSVCGLAPFSTCGSVAYSASKAGMDNLTKLMAQRLGVDGIRVNSINPGITQTPMWDGVEEDYIKSLLHRRHVLGQIVQPEDIAQAALFLASPKARLITGAILPVDAGYTIS